MAALLDTPPFAARPRSLAAYTAVLPVAPSPRVRVRAISPVALGVVVAAIDDASAVLDGLLCRDRGRMPTRATVEEALAGLRDARQTLRP